MLLDKNELFILTFEDLKKRLEAGTIYDLLRACGLVRQLIQEDTNLLNAINDNLHKRVKFIVPDVSDTPIIDITKNPMSIGWLSVDPSHPVFKKTKEIGTSKFLSTKVLKFNHQYFTVEHVILVSACYYGGVHYKKPYPTDKVYTSYVALEAAFTDDINIKMSVNAIKAICKVTIKALQPIVDVLKEKA